LNRENFFQFIKSKKWYLVFTLAVVIIGAFIVVGLISSQNNTGIYEGFPDFITKNEDYFITRIGNVPQLDGLSYALVVSGQVDNPGYFSLEALRALEMINHTLTTETIGNPVNGRYISTAVWTGFNVLDFLTSLGIKPNATGVKYTAADGYYASHTLDQLRDNGTLGALYMNGVELPPEQGFPLRIVNPGAFGAKQPAWVTEIEVLDRPLEDYWDDRGWDTSPPMPVDSIIFFPANNKQVKIGEVLEVGGAAYGGTRILKVEYSLNDGLNWFEANVVKSVDLDHVWIFWNASLVFNKTGTFTFVCRATDINNNTQPQTDSYWRDGINEQPTLVLQVST